MIKNLRPPKKEEFLSPIFINMEIFEEIYRLYWSDLFNAAYKRIKSVEKTEEIIQDLFTSLWEKRDKIEINESLSGYLFRSLKFRVLNHLRNEMVRSGHLNDIKLGMAKMDVSTEREIEHKELKEKIDREIKNLPEKCREVFLLSREEELSFKEIAQKLNISVNTVEKHVGKALRALRVNLKNHITILVISLLNF